MSRAVSSRFVTDRPKEVGQWVMDRVTHVTYLSNFAAIGVEREGRLIAGIVYHQHLPDLGDVQAVFAADDPSWAVPGNIGVLLSFAFSELDCQRVTALIARKNKRSRRFVEGIGFKLEGKQRRGLKTDDLMAYGMLKEEAEKWLRRTNGKVIAPIGA